MKKKQEMSLLSQGIVKFHENHPELFFQGSEYIALKEKELEGFVQEQQRIAFLNILGESSWEYYWGGIIDGFRMGIGLLKELDEFEHPDFLKDILLSPDNLDDSEQ